MMRDEQLSQREYVPDGIAGVVTVGISSSNRDTDSEAVLQAIRDNLVKHQRTDVLVRTTGGFGFLSAEVLVKIIKPGTPSVLYGGVTPDMVPELLDRHLGEDRPAAQYALCQIPANGEPIKGIPVLDEIAFFAQQQQVRSWRCGHIDPEQIDDAFRTGVYQTMDEVLRQSPRDTMATIETAQVHGHGGRGESITEQWAHAAARPGEKYLICNALEVETGSVKDRWILESDPHALIEGMVVAAYAVGAHLGYVVVNPSYRLAARRLSAAIMQARRHRRLGRRIRGTAFDFDIVVREGPAGYMTGEETVLVSFLAGEAGPRNVPPYMAESGLDGKPTVVANVETYVHLTTLPFESDEECPPPTRLFTLEGTVNTGIVEVEIGTTLRELVCGIGATPEDHIKAVVIGGHLGGILSSDLLDTPLNRQSFRWLGIWPGTGHIKVLDQSTSIPEWLRDHLRFAADESCGYCTPCREGMAQARRIADRLCDGQGRPNDTALLEQLATYVKTSSMCGYGHAVPGGITTAIRYFGNEIREQIKTRH